MKKEQARKLAELVVGVIGKGGNLNVKDTVYLIKEMDGTYSVTDNGEEVSGLDKAGAIRVIVENLIS